MNRRRSTPSSDFWVKRRPLGWFGNGFSRGLGFCFPRFAASPLISYGAVLPLLRQDRRPRVSACFFGAAFRVSRFTGAAGFFVFSPGVRRFPCACEDLLIATGPRLRSLALCPIWRGSSLGARVCISTGVGSGWIVRIVRLSPARVFFSGTISKMPEEGRPPVAKVMDRERGAAEFV